MWMTIDCVQNRRSLQEQRACDDTANFQWQDAGSLQWFMSGDCCQFEHRSSRGRFLTVCVDRLLQRERMDHARRLQHQRISSGAVDVAVIPPEGSGQGK